MKRTLLLVCVVLALLLAASAAYAMSSANYGLNWYELLTGSGGPSMASEHFAVNVTAGQSAMAVSAGPNNAVRMGYWSAFAGSREFHPRMLK